MNATKRLATNSFFYTGALIVQKVISSVYFWYYSNNLPGGAGDLGRFNYVLSFVALFFILGDFGLYLVFLRESSREPSKTNKYLNNLLTLKLPLILIAAIVILLVAKFYQPANLSLIILALAWVIMDNLCLTFYAVWRAHQNLKFESLAVILTEIVTVTIGTVSLMISGDVFYLMLALLIGTSLNFLFVTGLLIFKLHYKIRLSFDAKIVRLFLWCLPPFAISGILVKMQNSLDTVLLQDLTGNFISVGLYNLPLKIITALSLSIPTALMGAFYPEFSRLFATSSNYLYRIFQKALDYLLIISLPVAFGFLALGQEIVAGLWKNEYLAAVLPGKIMFFALPFIFLCFPTGNLLNAIGKQKFTAFSRANGLIVMVALDFILIPIYGVIGAAIALLCTHLVIFMSDAYFLRDYFEKIKKDFKNSLVRVLISSSIMFFVIKLLESTIPWYYLIVLGAVIYFTALRLSGGLDLKFLRYLFVKESKSINLNEQQ